MEYTKIIEDILSRIESAQKIVITAHKSPDGDSIGSSMALYHYLKQIGKNVVVCHPDPFPNFLNWVTGVECLIDFENHPDEVANHLQEADLVFALDYNDPKRLGSMQEVFPTDSSKVIMIDHHLHPSDFAVISYSNTNACSTAQLVFEVLSYNKKNTISIDSASAVYLGIMTDTGSFRFSSVEPRTHEILAQILALGVDHTSIHEQVFDQNSLNQLKLKSYAINENLEMLENNQVALVYLSQADLDRYEYQKGDTEGLVNLALSIQGVRMAIFLSEQNGEVKMSFRSKKDLFVNQLAADHFEGGGHAYAAGGISRIGLEETIQKVKSVVGKYVVA